MERDEIEAAVDLMSESASEALRVETELHPGAVFGAFQLLSEIGRGGLGHAYRARHVHPGYGEQDLALKILHARVTSNPTASEHFRQEAYLMSMIRHPNVVRTFEAGAEDGRLFIVMEYVSGRDLRQFLAALIREKLVPPVELAVFIVEQILDGLVAAHEMKSAAGAPLRPVHQDVNPSNVMLGFDGSIKLGDFGVAAVFGTEVVKQRMVAGTAGYFSPEQLAEKPFDQRTDVFSVGVILYELLTRRRLFYSRDEDELLDMNERAVVPSIRKGNREVSKELEGVARRALARDPDDRFQSAREMQEALRSVNPIRPSMSLGLAAMLRTVFVSELSGELLMRHGLGRTQREQHRHYHVALCAEQDDYVGEAIDTMLEEGHWVELNESVRALSTSLEYGSPDVLLAQLTSESVSDSVLNAVMRNRGSICPVVGMSSAFGVDVIEHAHRMGASDIFFGPVDEERIRVGLQAAVAGAGALAPRGELDVRGGRYRAALVGLSSAVGAELRVLLEANGYQIAELEDGAAALEHLSRSTFHVAIVDAETPEDGTRVVESLRAAPAMGPIPALCILPVVSSGRELGLPFSAVRSRDEDAIVVAHAVEALQGEASGVRRFERFDVDVEAYFRFGGRERKIRILDISRTGAGIRTSTLPTVDSMGLLSMPLKRHGDSLAVRCRVAYVDRPDSLTGEADIGLVFTGFRRDHESMFIRWLVELERELREPAREARA